MARIVILGAGVMGSAMAVPSAAKLHDIDLIGTHLDDAIIRSVQGNGLHPKLNIKLPSRVKARFWTDLPAVDISDADLIILGVSSAGVQWAIDRLVETLKRPVPMLMITKGLSPHPHGINTLPALVSHHLKTRLGFDVPVLAVGGPCIAGELAAERDTMVVITGHDHALLHRIIGLLDAPFYHARASSDVTGVEICAAFKNFFALGVGWAAGHFEQTDPVANNAKMFNLAAGLFTQSVRELQVLSVALGGTSKSAEGLPGVGDLYVTSLAGRNSRMGRLLGLGHSYTDAKVHHMPGDTVEGAELALAVGPTLEAMWADGRLNPQAMPLARAIVDAICHGAIMKIDWAKFML